CLHLALIAFFRDLFVEFDRRKPMHKIRRECFGVRERRRLVQTFPVRLRPFAQARDDPDACDPDFGPRISHQPPTPSEIRYWSRVPTSPPESGSWETGPA